ncbi:hypothetical protein GGTG_06666 [Gaeumannomyces tritici R3-111a-1]|uniref:Ryanodine receptor Ryr domain-containing protein n=1 Tax=Gaeumannomyces tritici (strain R3-111a-1) TaxID=644352 RepID=J3NZG7_GAET3|nr:hypothetical protein GGTG_06666 [Gaeumannomyces tritici R3-111a-1]EJT76750.1 hypothetical protein GGTG_06666 [Gaeumannomyces tritici R3-111a-1]
MVLSHISIFGAAPVQLFLFPLCADREAGDEDQRTGVEYIHGGVGTLADLLTQDPLSGVCVRGPDLGSPERGAIDSISELELCGTDGGRGRHGALKLAREWHVGSPKLPPKWYAPRPLLLPEGDGVDAGGSVFISIVLDADPGKTFPDGACDVIIDGIPEIPPPRFLVVLMTAPLCVGGLWQAVRQREHHRGRLVAGAETVAIVSADDLRAEGMQLSLGLSWEKTCEDFVEKLGSVGRLTTLMTCPHLVVLFGYDGVIYHRGREVSKPTLFFDPLCIEGDFARRNRGRVPGAREAFVAGFAQGLAQSLAAVHGSPAAECDDASTSACVKRGIESGFWAARRLSHQGLSLAAAPAASPASVYRTGGILLRGGRDLPDGQHLLEFAIPADRIARETEPSWSLLDSIVGDVTAVARGIVIDGPEAPGNQVAQARFGRLVLFDRHEIETFRTVFNLIQQYLSNPNKQSPLNIALCGPTGAGRAYAALQVAESATRGRNVRQLRFDLGKFACAADLTAAFYSIRDCAASPEAPIPLVYFDGFDTSLPDSTSPFGWLPHLAPAMLDGVFSDGGVARHMGRRAVFFFGASAVRTYADLKRRADANTDASAGVRSFLGCLHGCVDVLGPNRIDAADRLYPVRRAALLRALLEEREPKLKAGEKLRIDHGMLNGLLLVPSYPQGVRSIRSIIAMSRLDGCQRFEFAALPPRTQLNIHVDYDELLRHMSGIPIPREHREEMARGIHNAYNDSIDAMHAETPNKPSAEPWEALDEEKKESSRAHADSIPHKLRLVGCFLSLERDDRTLVKSFTPEDVDRMAMEEHDRWCSERLQKQWRLGPRDPKVRSSPFFVSWSELDKPWQDVDRDIVKRYPEILKPHGLMIYKVG